jgi:hypothetical protein
MINGKKHTPSSGTLKKMKARAAAEAAMAKAKPKASAMAKAKPKASAMAKAKPKAPVPANKYATPYVNPKIKAPIPVKMPEGIKNKRTNTMFTRGKMDPTGGL